ncbi:hypothetical protein [Mycobacteroides abscessus]|uniref:hypothetical protein n=1 Tax=Mycobacteroides abscessus TaxID=36809 RepID=UPI0005DEE816|nr:hypothetical protein [Mycobacteroides abscessus]CPW73037.1 Uncharacterised protein [Mycobacteroides abscessus]SKF61043.1 Uncharacterised protein [Mycobacteroides abscessus subsp. bolletii]SKH65260.1 Uncharacterised protein [Mycobacteroides abscessus subsp. bolletii]
MSTPTSGESSPRVLSLELSGFLIQAQEYANATGNAVQIMLADFKYGNTQSFEVTPEQEARK